MQKLKEKLKNVSTLKIAFVLFIALEISFSVVSGVFAKYQTDVTFTGSGSVSAWGFDLKVNGKEAGNDSVISGIDLATKESGALGSNTDSNIYLNAGKLAAGSAGYMSVELYGKETQVSAVVTVEATFLNLPDGFVFTDNVGRSLEKTIGITDFVPKDATVRTKYQDPADTSYTGAATRITYSYFISYDEIMEWQANTDLAETDKYVDIGFRWLWVSTDTDNSFENKTIYPEVFVSCEQVLEASDIPEGATTINFAETPADLQYGEDVLNVALADLSGDETDCDIKPTDDLYLDVNCLVKNGFDLSTKTYNVIVEQDVANDKEYDDDVTKIMLGTYRREGDYVVAKRPTATVIKANPDDLDDVTVSANAYVTEDFSYAYEDVHAYNLRAENVVDSLNTVLINKKISKDTPFDTLETLFDKKGTELDAYFASAVYTFDDVEKLLADSSDDTHFVGWDTASKRFVYIENDAFVKTETTKHLAGVGKKVSVFRFYYFDTDKTGVTGVTTGANALLTEAPEFSMYLGSVVEGVLSDLAVGLDVADNENISAVTYDRSTATTGQTVLLRTDSYDTALTVNAPKDTVYHYNCAGSVDIIAVAATSYHENGKVPFVEIAKGRVVLESESAVSQIHISTKIASIDGDGVKTKVADTFDKVAVATVYGMDLPTFSRDAVENINVNGTLVLEIQKENNYSDYVYLYQQGLKQQMKVTTAESGTVTILDGSAKNGNDKTLTTTTSTVVLDICNNIVGGKSYTEAQIQAGAVLPADIVENGIDTTDATAFEEIKNNVIATSVAEIMTAESDEPVFARIGMKGYTSFQDAVDDAADGATIVLLQSVEEGFSNIAQIFTKNLVVNTCNDYRQDDYGLHLSSGELFILDEATGLKYYGGGRQVMIDDSFTGTEAYIPEGVTEIVGCKQARKAVNMTKVYFPSTITKINGRVFCNCTNLEAIYYYDTSDEEYKEGLPPTLEVIGQSAFQTTPNLEIDVEIPDAVTSISSGVFYESGITAVTFHENVSEIGASAFRACPNLTEIRLPADVTTLGEFVCRDCANLTEYYFAFEELPETVGQFSFASVSGTYNNTLDRTVYVKSKTVASAFWSKLDSVAKEHYSFRNYDDTTIVYNIYDLIVTKGASKSYYTLEDFRDATNDGNNFSGYTISLVHDIDLKNEEWEPISNYAYGTGADSVFAGTFDGQNHTVSNLTIANNTVDALGATEGIPSGFFGSVGGCTIRNLKLSAVSITCPTTLNAGLFALHVVGTGVATVDNVQVLSGTVSSADNAAGLIAFASVSCVITDCVNRANVSGYSPAGIVGVLRDETNPVAPRIDGCVNYGTITSTDNSGAGAGGIAGKVQAGDAGVRVENCTNYGNIIATKGNTYAGGISGLADSVQGSNGTAYFIKNTNYGNVSSDVAENGAYGRAGGIIGKNSNVLTMRYCVNTGNVSGYEAAGGMMGYLDVAGSTVEYCYNSGTIACSHGAAGGIVTGGNSNFTTHYCLNDASVTGSTTTCQITGVPDATNYYYSGSDIKNSSNETAVKETVLSELNGGTETFFGENEGKIVPILLIPDGE